MKDVWVVTHTESFHHVKRLGGGWYDTHLTEKGKKDAQRIALKLYERIKKKEIPIISSDLKRCTDMAESFKTVFSGSFETDSRLREMGYGVAEGKAQKWQQEHIQPRPIDNNRIDHRVFGGAESRRDIGQRITNFVNDKLANIENTVLVITHGFALTFIIMAWMNIPVVNMDYCKFSSFPGGVTQLREDDFFGNKTLVSLNDMSFIS